MRKIVSTLKGPKEVYESNLVIKKNKEFYRQLKTVKAYYSAKKWEDEYKDQV